MDWMPIVEVRYLLVPIYFFKLFSHYSQLNSIVRVSCSVCVYLFPPPTVENLSPFYKEICPQDKLIF